MALLPRYTIPEQPQHVIQRGNNRGIIFVARSMRSGCSTPEWIDPFIEIVTKMDI